VFYGDKIHVARGVYRPAPAGGDKMATFQLADGVAMLGGFAGAGAEDPDAREVSTFKSVLSGDLNGNDETENELDDNSRHVLTGSGTSRSALLEGFVISGGVGSYNGSYGGGIFNLAGSPTVLRCVFTKIRGDRTYSGNAIYGRGESYPVIANCVFEGGGESRAVTCENPSTPTIVNCVFVDCSWAAIEQYGGAPLIANCVFAGCKWGLFLDYSDADIRNCLFYDNEYNLQLDGESQPVLTDCIDGVAPAFVDRLGGDYHLEPGSPCIDAGYNAAVQPGWVDLEGNERIINDVVDIGVYESPAPEVIEANLRISPQTINRNNRQARILARVRLPESVTIEMIDRNHPLVLLPGEIQADRQHVLSTGRSEQEVVYVFAFFKVDKLLQAVRKDGNVDVTVTGRLTDGRLFTGADTVRIGSSVESSRRSSAKRPRTSRRPPLTRTR
jgi:hypothetical protein